MTLKQQRFVDEYMVDMNATQAAIRAGYSEKTAYSIGEQLLRKLEVSESITARQAALSRRIGYDVQQIFEGITAIAEDAETRPADRLKAFELMGKHLGMFRDRVGVSLELPQFIDVWAEAGDDDECE
ncbi:hypothetical protein AGMMS49992_31230 [Clostridia bacterium]|nr:hypothetical protein AGMMS49992_31230 [Clostridia bacterium]